MSLKIPNRIQHREIHVVALDFLNHTQQRGARFVILKLQCGPRSTHSAAATAMFWLVLNAWLPSPPPFAMR